mmetsp:Transcript_107671/g.347528  ORF Transcript_107671/g.347528 Transcript_107671/m.347528 type:complete len:278 (+) Transcript_107671:403-1236(+)
MMPLSAPSEQQAATTIPQRLMELTIAAFPWCERSSQYSSLSLPCMQEHMPSQPPQSSMSSSSLVLQRMFGYLASQLSGNCDDASQQSWVTCWLWARITAEPQEEQLLIEGTLHSYVHPGWSRLRAMPIASGGIVVGSNMTSRATCAFRICHALENLPQSGQQQQHAKQPVNSLSSGPQKTLQHVKVMAITASTAPGNAVPKPPHKVPMASKLKIQVAIMLRHATSFGVLQLRAEAAHFLIILAPERQTQAAGPQRQECSGKSRFKGPVADEHIKFPC